MNQIIHAYARYEQSLIDLRGARPNPAPAAIAPPAARSRAAVRAGYVDAFVAVLIVAGIVQFASVAQAPRPAPETHLCTQ